MPHDDSTTHDHNLESLAWLIKDGQEITVEEQAFLRLNGIDPITGEPLADARAGDRDDDSDQPDEGHTGSDTATPRDDGPEADSAQDEATQRATSPLPSTEEIYRRIYGTDPGYICLVSLLRGKDGKPLPEDTTQRFYQYPSEFDEAMARLPLWSGGRDEYLCAHLLSRKERSKDAALSIWSLYADIDDAPIPVGDLRPSVLIESSPGRHQGHWLLDRPLDPAVAEELNERLTLAIGADESGYDLTQLLRPAGTVNHKREELFTVRLVEANMHTVDPNELDRILPPLPAKASGKPRTKAGAGAANETPTDDGTAAPPVRLDGEALRRWRGEIPKMRDGRVDRSRSLAAIAYDLAWANASQEAIYDALVERDATLGWDKYTGRDDQYDILADQALYAVEQKLGPPQDEYDEPPKQSTGTPGDEAETPRPDPVERVDVDVSHGDLNRVGARVLAAMDKGNLPERIFVGPTGEIARIVRTVEDQPIIQALTEHMLRYEAQRMIRPTKPGTAKIPTPVETALPLDVVRNMAAREKYPFPPAQRIIPHPMFGDRSFDSLMVAAGYSRMARAYVSPDPGFALPQPISRTPSREEIAWAVAGVVEEWLPDFPFVGDADQAHAIAYFLLPFVRNLIEGATPHHLFDAPGAGTGKGLLQSVLSSPAKGRGGAATMAMPENDAEMRKLITSMLMRGETHVVFGNVSETIDSAALSEAMTTEAWTDRILGGNTTITVPVRLIWGSTGNNIGVSAEQARRSIRIRMDAKTDRPFERTGFRHPDLSAWSTEHRGDLVWAALTMTSAWIAAGCPAGTRTLGSFEEWARVMGGILDVAGIPDFLANSEDLYATADSESDRWRALLTAWLEVYGTTTVTTAMIFGLPPVSGLFDFRSDHVDGQRRELGHAVAAKRDHTFGDLRIVGHGNNRLGLKEYSLAHKDGNARDPKASTARPMREEDQINPFDKPPAYAA